MLHLCHFLLACVALAAAAPSSKYHGHGTECRTENKKVCEKTWEGEGENMKWVDIPGTCEYQPHDECKDVTKEQCTKNAKKMCEDKHKRIPVRVSKKVPKKVCDEDDGYANPISIPEYDEYEVIDARSSGK